MQNLFLIAIISRLYQRMNRNSEGRPEIEVTKGYHAFFGLFFCAWLCLFSFQQGTAQTPVKLRSTLGVGGSSKAVSYKNRCYIIRQSIAQTSVIGSFRSSGFVLHQGFIQPSIYFAKVEEQEAKLMATVYPNSFASDVTITFGEAISCDIKVAVCDLSGRLVFSCTYKPTQVLDVNLHFFASGLYVVRITSGKKVFSTKLIKD